MNPSYWKAGVAVGPFPSIDRDIDVDVIVVGAGLTGITAAYLIKNTGKTVALIERNRCIGGDTNFTTAHLTSVTDLRIQEIVDNFGRGVARAVWDAGCAAIDQIASNVRFEEIDCDFHWMPGYLHCPPGDLGLDKISELEREARVTGELGIRANFMPAVPFFNVPGVKFSHQAIFHPRKYLAALLRTLPGDGSYVFEQSPVEEITSDDPLIAKVRGHEVRGRYVVMATHNPLMGMASAMQTMLMQTKLALYTSYAVGGRVPAGTIPRALFWDTSDPYHYLRVEPKNDHDYVIFGGEDHKTGQQPDTHLPYDRLEQRIKMLLPQIEIDHRWSGQVIETNDGLPFIGEMVDRQFIATGFSGNGMTFGTMSALLAVNQISGGRSPWADVFAVDRKKLIGGTWTYLQENLDYPLHLVRDWLAAGSEGDSLDQLPEGQGKILNLDGEKTAAYRDENGKVTLCSPICPHLKCTVGWNDAEKTWDCPCHGSRFKPTGEVISGPAQTSLEPAKIGAAY